MEMAFAVDGLAVLRHNPQCRGCGAFSSVVEQRRVALSCPITLRNHEDESLSSAGSFFGRTGEVGTAHAQGTR